MPDFPKTHQDLLKTDIGILATIGPKGFPQLTALWFLHDSDGFIRISLNTKRQKVKNLRRNPECTFFLLDRANPQRTMEVRTIAEIDLDPDYRFAEKINKKYGADLREFDGQGATRVVVTLRPIMVNVHV
jgi:PPOX class probable F420-dependent enzyme